MSRPLRVAVLFEYPTVHGGEQSILAVIDHLRQDGWQFVGSGPTGGRLQSQWQQRGLPFVAWRRSDARGTRLPQAEAWENLLTDLEGFAPDIIHANSLSMARISGAQAAVTPCVCTGHLRDILRLSRTACRALSDNRGLIAVSQATHDHHHGQSVAPEHFRVIWNGIDTLRFRPRPATGRLHAELRLPIGTPLIGTIGQVSLRKGQNVVAAAVVRLLQRGSLGQAPHLVLIGERVGRKAETIQYELGLRQTFEQAGFGEHVHSLGYRPEVCDLLSEFAVVAHAARQEPLGRVLLEAAACGRPIVATAVGGTTEILTDQESAVLVPPDRPDALADALRTVLADGDLAKRLGRVARERIERDFSIASSAARHAAFWSSVVGES